MSFLDEAAKAYYEGNPIIEDSLFDSMAEKSGYKKVGYNGTVEDKHYLRLYSLNKIYDIKDVPFTNYIDTPKLDGLAISLLYVDGKLEKAITRGDGIVGKVITDKIALLVPNTIYANGEVFITGEVVALSSIENSRNYASGSCNLKDLEEFKNRVPNLKFIAYNLQGLPSDTYMGYLLFLSSLGFSTVLDSVCDEYPQDGRVLRMDNTYDYCMLGYTAKFPRGAIALKSREEEEIKETILLDVVWQLGGSKVSPVAIFEEVILGDAKVTRATLHNAGFVEELDLHIGDTLLVRRSGQIIPQIIGKVWV